MARCPQCGNDNEPGAAFCDMCGAKLPAAAPESAAPQSATPPSASAVPVAAAAVPPAGLTCPSCHHPYLPGEAFCGECGAQLPAPGAAIAPASEPAPAEAQVAPLPPQPAPVQPAPQPSAAPAGQMQCPTCGALFGPGQQFCDQDGTRLVPATVPPPVVTPPPIVAPPPISFLPRLVVVDGGAELALSGKTEFLVGRTDPPSGVFADIDLSPHKGEEGGVSRRHAIVRIAGNQVTIEDQNSTNFTYVNKQRLQPNVPQVLNDGDEIRMGRVVLHYHAS
jgi:hypothetical protein